MAFTEYQRRGLRHPLRWLSNDQPEDVECEEIPRRELTFFTLGLWGQNHLFQMAGSGRFMHFMTDILRLPVAWVGNMLLGKRVFDALNDPIAGAIIDAYRFKNGEKLLPWIKYLSPLIAFTAFSLFINWGLSPAGAAAFCVIMFIIWGALYAFQDAALWGITAIIHPANSQRARATQWGEMGAFLGGLLPGLTMALLGSDGNFGLNRQQLYFVFGVVFCLIGGFQTMLACKITERVHQTGPIENKLNASNLFRELGRNIWVLRHNKVLILFLISETVGALSPRAPDIYMFQQMGDMHIFGDIYLHPTLVVTLVGIVVGFPGQLIRPFGTKIIERIGGMKRLMIISRVAGIISGVVGYFIGVHTFPRLLALNVIGQIAGLPGNINGIAMRTMISDSVEYVDWKVGQRTEGITMSMRNLMAKVGGALGQFMEARTLVWLQYQQPRPGGAAVPQNAHFYRWIWPAHRLGPQISALMGLIPLLLINYPESMRRQVESDLAERRAAAAEVEIRDGLDG